MDFVCRLKGRRRGNGVSPETKTVRKELSYDRFFGGKCRNDSNISNPGSYRGRSDRKPVQRKKEGKVLMRMQLRKLRHELLVPQEMSCFFCHAVRRG